MARLGVMGGNIWQVSRGIFSRMFPEAPPASPEFGAPFRGDSGRPGPGGSTPAVENRARSKRSAPDDFREHYSSCGAGKWTPGPAGFLEVVDERALLTVLRIISKRFNFDTGGVVPGALGQPQLAVVHGGEEVLTPGQRRGTTVVNNFDFRGSFIGNSLVQRMVNQATRDHKKRGGGRG